MIDLKTTVVIAWCVTAILPCSESARLPPPDVEPIEYDGVRYEVPNDDGRRGYVRARDAKTGAKLWEKTLFKVRIFPLLETDAQLVFINQMRRVDDNLYFADEHDRCYKLDLKRKNVKSIRNMPSESMHKSKRSGDKSEGLPEDFHLTISETTVGRAGDWRIGVGNIYKDTYQDESGEEHEGHVAPLYISHKRNDEREILAYAGKTFSLGGHRLKVTAVEDPFFRRGRVSIRLVKPPAEKKRVP